MALFWVGFHVLLVLLLFVDLKYFHKKERKIQFRQACLHSVFWIALALIFNGFIYVYLGEEYALQFFAGYLIEKTLSVDNLFLFLLVFLHFKTPLAYQHKILFWGIIGALISRIGLILLGILLIGEFHWILYVFGVFLLATGVKFLLQKEKTEFKEGFIFRFFKRVLPVAHGEETGDFFVKRQGKWKVTTLFLVLLVIECTDIMFALDSIPAIFAITTNPFIVYTSNVFAILGLRSLYFMLEASIAKLRYYKYGLAAILVFIGAKMLLAHVFPISVPVSLAVILAILGVTTLASLKFARRKA